jgi:hypothetical protein
MERQKIGITGQQEVGPSGERQLEKLVVARIATEFHTLGDMDNSTTRASLCQKPRALGK